MNRVTAWAAACGLMICCLWTTAHAAGGDAKWLEPDKSALLAHPDQLPFFPHRANTTDNHILAGNAFDNAQICGGCHQDIYAQWRTSAMAQAWEDPIYRGLLKRASEATGGKLDNFCTGCHTPVGLTTGQISSAVNRMSPEASAASHPMPGVDCEACHNISARTGLDNGAYVLQPRAHDNKPTKFGPRKDAVSPYHETVYSPLHTRSDFCGTCHNVTHPFNGVPIERTYDEWLESEYAQNGEPCQSCHMPSFKGRAAIMGPEREDVASHWFTGANSTLLSHFGDAEAAERGRDMLRKAANMSIVNPPQRVAPGQLLELTVDVHNASAGHKLPTGFPEGREIWIDLVVTDADGRQLYRSGAVRDGRTEPGTRNFRVHLGDKDGKEVEYEVWNVTHVLADNRILPKGHASNVYSFVLPAKLRGPLKVSATLNYWAFSQALVDFLVGPGQVPVDIVAMTTAEARIEVSRQVAQADASAKPPGTGSSPAVSDQMR